MSKIKSLDELAIGFSQLMFTYLDAGFLAEVQFLTNVQTTKPAP